MAERKRRGKRGCLVKLGLVAASISVALVAAEMYYRSTMSMFRGPAFDLPGLFVLDDNGWPTPAPGYEGEVHWHGRTTKVVLNSLGMRGEEFGARAPGEKRILAVGDSVVFGLGVEAEETFADHLEELLSDKTGTPHVVRIGGAPGFGTLDLGPVVEKLAPHFEPDLILAGIYLGNDLHDNFRVSRTVVDGYLRFGPFARANESWRLRWAVKYRLWFKLEHNLLTYFPSLGIQFPSNAPEIEAYKDFPPDPKHVGFFFMDELPVPDGTHRILDRMEAGLRQLAAAAGDVPVLLLILPKPEHCKDEPYARELGRLGLDPEKHERGTLQRLITERCARVGLDVLDLTPVIEATKAPFNAYLKDLAHLNAAGHELVAAHLAEILPAREW